MHRYFVLFAMLAVMIVSSTPVFAAKPVGDDTSPKQVYLRPMSYDVTFNATTSELVSGDFWFLIWILQGPRRLSLAPGTGGYTHYEVIREAMRCPLASSNEAEGVAAAQCQEGTLGSCLKVTYDPVADVVLSVQKTQERRCYLADQP